MADERIAALLAAANGARKNRLLDRSAVALTIAEACRAPSGVAFRHAGLASTSTQPTTICLAVRLGDCVTVGVTTTGGVSGSPGRAPAWVAELRPWRVRLEDNLAQCRAWAGRRAADRVSMARPRVAKAAPSASRPELLQAVLEAPDDDAPRLVYADWLQERGDPRGELIALQCRGAAPERVRALLRTHEQAWLAPLRPLVTAATLRRGFVEEVTVKADTFLERGEELFAAAPIRAVTLSHLTRDLIPDVAASPLLARLTSLTIGCHGKPCPAILGRGLRVLLASPHLHRLRRLATWNQKISVDGAEALAASRLGALEELSLFGDILGPRGADALAGWPRFAKLRMIDLSYCGLADAGAAAVIGGAAGAESLRLGSNGLGPATASTIAATRWKRLRRLDLYTNRLRDQGAALLAGARNLRAVRELVLPDNQITPKGVAALAAARHLGELIELDLGANRVGADGARALLESRTLPALRRVICASTHMPPKLAAELRARFG